MENKIVHPKLGEFIEKVLKVAHVNLSKMCQEIHMGPATYQKVKKGKKKLWKCEKSALLWIKLHGRTFRRKNKSNF